jgi:hypothetical protein
MPYSGLNLLKKNLSIRIFSRCRASPPYAFSLYAFLDFVKGVLGNISSGNPEKERNAD